MRARVVAARWGRTWPARGRWDASPDRPQQRSRSRVPRLGQPRRLTLVRLAPIRVPPRGHPRCTPPWCGSHVSATRTDHGLHGPLPAMTPELRVATPPAARAARRAVARGPADPRGARSHRDGAGRASRQPAHPAREARGQGGCAAPPCTTRIAVGSLVGLFFRVGGRGKPEHRRTDGPADRRGRPSSDSEWNVRKAAPGPVSYATGPGRTATNQRWAGCRHSYRR
jgi:hypothetical protein